jgi:hypothetical protein
MTSISNHLLHFQSKQRNRRTDGVSIWDVNIAGRQTAEQIRLAPALVVGADFFG